VSKVRTFTPAVLVSSVVLLAGCGGMLRADITVELDKTLTRDAASIPTVQVDLIAVNQSELPQWKGYAVSKYWSPGDSLRDGADKYEMRFDQTRSASQMLQKTDAVFGKWSAKTASHLFVLADLPGVQAPKEGEADARRLILPLSAGAWKLTKKGIVITIRSGQMLCSPAPKKDQ
jgi:hypothetical protein